MVFIRWASLSWSGPITPRLTRMSLQSRFCLAMGRGSGRVTDAVAPSRRGTGALGATRFAEGSSIGFEGLSRGNDRSAKMMQASRRTRRIVGTTNGRDDAMDDAKDHV